jgi:rubredoxin
VTILTTIDPQPAILTHRCSECEYIWQERKYQRRDGSWPDDAQCPMCAAKDKPAGPATEK